MEIMDRIDRKDVVWKVDRIDQINRIDGKEWIPVCGRVRLPEEIATALRVSR